MLPIPVGVWTVEHSSPSRQTVTVERGAVVAHALDRHLRVWLSGGKLYGFWIQDPPAQGTTFAAPIDLVSSTPDRWTGTFVPLDDSPEYHFVSLRNASGQNEAFIRDPIANVGAHLGTFHPVSNRDGTRWIDGHGNAVARFNSSDDSVVLTLPDAPERVAHRDKTPFLDAAPPDTSTLIFDSTNESDDYWRAASPEAAHLNREILVKMAGALTSLKTTTVRSPYIQTMIVARGNNIVFQRFLNGWSPDRSHDLRSASKSLTPVLMGAAMQGGARVTARSPLLPFFTYASYANDTPKKHQITIADALAMNTGLACDDYEEDSPGSEDRMQQQRDWYKFILDLKIVSDPGTQAAYCSGGINLVNGAIAAATKEWTGRLFLERLAQPLDLRTYYLPISPAGEIYGGGGFWMRPWDFMKFGRLYMQHGRWNGRQLIPKAWVEETVSMHSTMPGHDTYGFGWHLREYRIGSRLFHSYEAGGNGGQLLAVFPEEDLLVMMTAANYGQFPVWRTFHDYVTEYVLPAVN